jgi:hypothetical protein
MTRRVQFLLVALGAVALGVILWAVVAMNNDPAVGRYTPTAADKANAAQEWANMDPRARNMVCDIFLSGTGINGKPMTADTGYEQAKIDLMAGACTDE